MTEQVVDIYSKGEYPADVLSNFYPNAFVFDGVECGSVEGFLQSMKYRTVKKQKAVCKRSGLIAKRAGRRKLLWRLTGRIYWLGVRYNRRGGEFGALLRRAYGAVYAGNTEFKRALEASKGKKLIHSVGKSDERKTILTEKEFVDILEELRAEHI